MTPAQIRAARALLDWTQPYLAQESGVGVSTITAIEKGARDAGQETMLKIKRTFTDAGIVFTASGVELRDTPVHFLDGSDCYARLMDRLIGSVTKNDEVLFLCADDRRSSPDIDRRVDELRAKCARLRFLVEEGNNVRKGSLSEYRSVPSAFYAGRDVTVVWKNLVAFYLPPEAEGLQPRVMLIDSPVLARNFTSTFNYFWNAHSLK